MAFEAGSKTADTTPEVKMNSNDVLNTQRLLKNLGYYSGAVDGQFGTMSRAALHSAVQSIAPTAHSWKDSIKKPYSDRIAAFLDMIAYAEGTIRFGIANGYNVIVGGHTFSDFSDHPRRTIDLPKLGIKSTAAGRYQILSRFWDVYKKQLNLPDFGPDSQDRYAIQQIREQGAYGDVVNGNFDAAIRKCANIWASLPGAGYGQREVNRSELVAYANQRLLKYQDGDIA